MVRYVAFLFTDPDGNVETVGMVPAKDDADEDRVIKLIEEQMTDDQRRRGCFPEYIAGGEPSFIADIKKHAATSFGESLEDWKSYGEPGESAAFTEPSGGDE